MLCMQAPIELAIALTLISALYRKVGSHILTPALLKAILLFGSHDNKSRATH